MIAPSASPVRAWYLRPEVLLFLITWFALGIFIKSTDLEAYNLQQMGVDSIVEHGTFALGLSQQPLLQPRGDVFEFRGKLLAAKQPGQFAIGAIAYAPLRLLGLSYDSDYVSTSAWVTWLSSTSFAALAVALLFYLCHRIYHFAIRPSIFAAIALGFGTHLFAYSGVAHHDVIAGSLAFAAFVALESGRRSEQSRAWLYCGLLCGLSVFVSMLPALIVFALLIAAFVFGVRNREEKRTKDAMRLSALGRTWYAYARWKSVISLFVGFGLGVLPLALHNWHYFGAPWIQANAAGNYSDTFFHPTLSIFLPHLWRYLGFGDLSLWMHAPIAGFGWLAWIVLAARLRHPAKFTPEPNTGAVTLVLAASLIHLTYVLNIETYGHCQFGPRYLLPLMAFFCASLAWVWNGEGSLARRAFGWFAGAVMIVSIAINATGALLGTMDCDLSRWLPFAYWTADDSAFPRARFPLLAPLTIGLALSLLLAAYAAWTSRRDQPTSSMPE